MKIELPRTVADFRLKHAARLMEFSQDKANFEPTMLNKCKHLAAYSGSPIKEIRKQKAGAINKAFAHCMNLLSQYVKSEPKKKITIEGTVYKLIDPFSCDTPGGWLVDWEARRSEFINDPSSIMAMVYIEKGKEYGDIPFEDRRQLFYDEFPAVVFFDVNAFFLLKSKAYLNATALVNIIRIKEMNKKDKKKRKRMTKKKSTLLTRHTTSRK